MSENKIDENMDTKQGMSPRDYFAAHAPPPCYKDLAAILGWPEGLPETVSHWLPDKQERKRTIDCYEKRWAETPYAARLQACVDFRWRWADAMIRARSTQPQAGKDKP